ncbi:MAG TPA: hypothetical protein PKD70_14540 [Saprospiraceae bacterium]|nr:hypothetical protein [Saprospiraceae bacterium]HMP15093.1 hypothetical protein [Saprospiraceae bacterium]
MKRITKVNSIVIQILFVSAAVALLPFIYQVLLADNVHKWVAGQAAYGFAAYILLGLMIF